MNRALFNVVLHCVDADRCVYILCKNAKRLREVYESHSSAFTLEGNVLLS